MNRGKYRLRTLFREMLPERFAALAPKGRSDCGAHEWYAADDQTWRCYHCNVGVTHEVPWGDRELAARELELDAMRIRAGLDVQERLPLVHSGRRHHVGI